ncbi:MAG: hypothetical protein ACYDDT_04385 [Sulfuricella sp.]
MHNAYATASCKLQAASCKLQAASCKLQAASCKLQAASCKPLTDSATAQEFKQFSGPRLAILGALLLAASPLAAQPSDTAWAAHNRTITVSLGALRQDYTENDPTGLTTDGTLDTERGTLGSAELGARWQAKSLPLLLQATARRNSGGTRYSGYLQTGNLLTPYSATTGNTLLDYAVRAGFPIAQGESWQWVPFIEFQHHRWQRGLAQYTENFSHTAGLAGLQAQWRQQTGSETAAGPWSFEIEGAVGQMLSANMDATSLGFDQPLGKRGLWQLGATLGYDLAPRWRISAGASVRRFSYGQSALQAGMVEPSGHTLQTTFGIGLGRRY